MEETTENRKRAPNFSGEEKALLYSLMRKYSRIIEDKKTNKTSMNDKLKAWKKIEEEFNALSPAMCFRDFQCLKRFYENKKKDVRKLKAQERQEIIKTGGGPTTSVKADATDDILLSIINEKTVHGLVSSFDCDAVQGMDTTPYNTETENDAATIVFELEDVEDVVVDEIPRQTNLKNQAERDALNDWSKYTPDDLRKPLTPALNSTLNKKEPMPTPKSTRRRPLQTTRALASSDVAEQYNTLLTKRRLLVEAQLKQCENEEIFRRQKQALEIQLLQLEVEIKKKQLHAYS